MTSDHLEIEQKYDVDESAAWVDLALLPEVTGVGKPDVSSLEATCYDTDRLDLMRAGITLRRRTGGSGAGWHLKVPSGAGDRIERGEPLGADNEPVPPILVDRVQAWTRDRELRPAATLSTSRTVHRLFGPDEAVLAEAADDQVTSQVIGNGAGATVGSWREWEIELVDGPRAVLDDVGAQMRAAGARPSRWSSKVQRALADRLADLPARPLIGPLAPDGRAGDVLLAHLTQQVDAVLQRDWQARHDEPDGVHKMRVATRRLRSALATFRPLLDREITDPLREELKWLAGELGAARDAEVLRMRLLDELAKEPEDLVLGPVTARIEAELRGDHRQAHDALVAALSSERYYRLLDRLDELVTNPPFTPAADGSAEKVLTKRVRNSYGRVRAIVVAGPPRHRDHRDEWYHEIRKASKRLRYAAESVEPAFGRDATTLAEAAETVQEVLGEHQDSVVARQTLRDLGARIHMDGDNAFTIGRLHALEQTRGEVAVAEFEKAWDVLSKKNVVRWLKTDRRL